VSPRNGVASPGVGGVSSRRGLRADEILPFFRGEGWIEGSWKKEDVAWAHNFFSISGWHARTHLFLRNKSATIASSGARAIWDPRYDSSRSQTVELLSETDTWAPLRRGYLTRPNTDSRITKSDYSTCIFEVHSSQIETPVWLLLTQETIEKGRKGYFTSLLVQSKIPSSQWVFSFLEAASPCWLSFKWL